MCMIEISIANKELNEEIARDREFLLIDHLVLIMIPLVINFHLHLPSHFKPRLQKTSIAKIMYVLGKKKLLK